MIKQAFRNPVILILLSVLLISSCGPSAEEKARKIALRDSASIDSALKKEDSIRKAARRQERLKKEALKKAARDSARLKLDSARLNQADSLKKANTDDSLANPGHSLIKKSGNLLPRNNPLLHKTIGTENASLQNPAHRVTDTAAFNRERRLHRRNALDSLHKKRLKKPVPVQTDTSVQ